MFQVMGTRERLETVSISFIKSYVLKYGLLSLAMLVAVFTYEQFSNGITSLLMRFSVILPLIFGVFLESLNYYLKYKIITQKLIKMSMVTLMIGMFLFGVFEIYGNQSVFVPSLFYIGYGLIALSILAFFFERKKSV